MALYTHDGPGDWRQFILREDVKNLPTMATNNCRGKVC